MPTTDISVAFIKQYEAEVHLAYQQQGTLLRNTVRTKNNVKGKSTTFQKIGTGSAGQKDRHGKVPTMNLAHSNVEVTLQDWYAGEWCDKLDEIKTNIDERGAAAKSGAYALGRKTDELIIAAMSSATGLKTIDATSRGMTLNAALAAFEAMNDNKVPQDGERYCAVTPNVWNQLMLIDQFAKSNYVDDKPWMKGYETRKWLGINWIQHTALPSDRDAGVDTCFMYHKSAIGHASGADVTSDIAWHNDYASHFINNMMSQGAGIIDKDGIVKLQVKRMNFEEASSGSN